MEWIAIGVVKLANPNRAKKDQRAYERSMWKNGKKKKKNKQKLDKVSASSTGKQEGTVCQKNQFSDRSVRAPKFCLFVFSYFSDHAETKL